MAGTKRPDSTGGRSGMISAGMGAARAGADADGDAGVADSGAAGAAAVSGMHTEPPPHTFAEWLMPDPDTGSPVRSSYTVEGDIVIDNVTHLVWQRTVPETYAGCEGRYMPSSGRPHDACTWEEAKRYCAREDVATLLGGSGWRLPTRIELESLLDHTRTNPTIDIDAFPLTPHQSFWTASNVTGLDGFAWGIFFAEGATGRTRVTETCYVRCVRSAATP